MNQKSLMTMIVMMVRELISKTIPLERRLMVSASISTYQHQVDTDEEIAGVDLSDDDNKLGRSGSGSSSSDSKSSDHDSAISI
ncbi:hypothetical protein V6N12_027373 [Hibiscus sabdariffa]|uniref:Uncharacterized protein n=1 Tax=Hibiscus sabdariffa TaxID=183260 RepID=A0ABR2DUI8_9ROSI